MRFFFSFLFEHIFEFNTIVYYILNMLHFVYYADTH